MARDVSVRLNGDVSQFISAMNQAKQAASSLGDSVDSAQSRISSGASASSEALFRMSGGLSGTASEAVMTTSALTGVGDGLQGLTTSFAEGLNFSQGFSGALLSVGQTALEIRGHFSDFGSTLRNIHQETPQFAAGMAAIGGGLTALMTSLIKTGIEYNSLQQVAGRSMEQMTDSAAEAADQMDRFDDFASTSPFFRDSWLRAQRQLMAFGMEAKDVIPSLEGIEEAVAAIGGGEQEIMQLVDIFGQIQGQGRMTGRELQRMGQMGIDAADIMGEALGMTGNEIREQITAGAMDADTALSALASGMSTRFEGSAEAIRHTFQGATNDVIAAWRDLGSVLAEPLVGSEGGGLLVGVMNSVADFLRLLQEVNPVILQVGGGLVSMAGLVALAGGTWALAGTQIAGFILGAKNAFVAVKTLGTGLVSSIGGFRRLATGVGIAAAAMAGLAIVRHISGDMDDFVSSTSRMNQALLELSQGQQNVTDDLVNFERSWSLFGTSVEGLSGAMERVNEAGKMDAFRSWGGDLLGITNDITVAQEAVERFDESVATAFTEGNFDQAAAGFQEVSAQADNLGMSAEEVAEMYPQMTSAIRDAATAAGTSVSDHELLAVATNAAALEALRAGESWETIEGIIDGTARAMSDASGVAQSSAGGLSDYASIMGEIAEASSEAADALDSVVDSYRALGIIQLDAVDALATLEENFRSLNDSVLENGTSLDVTTEAGAANFRAFRQAAEGAWDLASAQLEAGQSADSVTEGLMGQYARLVEVAEGMDTGRFSAEEYAARLMAIPEERWTDVEAYFEDFASDGVEALNVKLEGIPDLKQVRIESNADGTIQEVELLDNQIRAIEDQTVSVITTDDGTILEVQGAIEGITDGDALIHVDDDGTITEVQGEITGMQDGQAVIEVDDDGTISIVQGEIDDISNGSALVDVSGDTTPAQEAIAALEDGDYSTVARIIGEDEEARATITALVNEDPEMWARILGDDSPARGTLQGLSDEHWTAPIIGEADVGAAVAQLDEVSRHRIAMILAEPDAVNAEGELSQTARDRISTILAASDTGLAESDLTQTARNRIAEILAQPNTYNAEGQLTQTARQRIADILADPHTWAAESDLNNTARDRWATITASAATWKAEIALNNAARTRYATIQVGATGRGLGALAGRLFSGGGRVPSFSTGGQLPYTGLGTDMILGVTSKGRPIANVDDGEFITRRSETEKHLPLLRAINGGDISSMRNYLQNLAGGGVAGRREFVSSGSSRGSEGINYERLAQAIGASGKQGPNFTFHTYNSVAESPSETAQKVSDIIAIGGDPSDVNGGF